MATADKVTVELEARRGRFDRDIMDARAKFQKEVGAISSSASVTERRVRASSYQIAGSLRNIASGIAAGATVGAIIRIADGYTQLQNRLKVVGLEGEKLLGIQNRLYEVANRNGVAVGDLAQLYSRVALNNQTLGASQEQLIRVSEAAAAALRTQGLSAVQARGPLLQLAQTLGSDIARAEEYNSVIEGIPSLAQAVARGLGVATTELGALVRDGQVTAQQYFQALLKGSDELISNSRQARLTIGQSLQVLNNELGRYVGQTDQSTSATERLSSGIIGLANNLDKIIPAITVIGGVFATQYVASLVASGVAQDGFIARGYRAVADTLAQEQAKTRAVANGARARTAAYTAESIALRAQVDSGRNAQGQFISRAAASAQLANANRNLAASIIPATAATVRQTGAVVAATAGARALGSGLLALAGGPVGLATFAIAGLAAGIAYLIIQNTDAAISAKALESVERRALPTKTKLEALTLELASASRERAAAIREEINEIINLERVELARLKAVADAEKNNANTASQVGRYTGGVGLEGGLSARDQAALRQELEFRPYANDAAGDNETAAVRRANAEYEAQKKLVEGYDSALKDATASREALTKSEDNAGAGGEKNAEQRAREAEQRRRLLADLESQTAIEEASLGQNVARVRELEREAEIVARIRQLQDAGFSAADAQTQSALIQRRLDAARTQELQRQAEAQQRNVDLTVAELSENYENVRTLERQEELNELISAHKKTALSDAEALERAEADLRVIEEARAYAAERYLAAQTRSHSIRIAELTGNDRLVKQMRDLEEIERRTAEYRQQGRLSPEQALRQATNEVTAERSATEYGEQRDFFASTFSEGIRAAWSGDLQGFLSSQFGNLADMALRSLGESLFDSFTNAPAAIAQAQAEGAAQGSAIAITIGPAITGAGTIAATEMGAAILAAGSTVAAQIAAASATSSISVPGFANGTRSAPGGLAVVGERGPELVNLPRGSQVIPNHQLNSNRAAQQPVVKLVVEEGSLFAARVQSVAGPISVEAATTGVLYSQDQQLNANKRQGQSFLR